MTALQAVGGVIHALTVPAPTGVRPLGELPTDFPGGTRTAQCRPRFCAELADPDLHYGNVLRDLDHTGWAAIDPKAVSGDPKFCVPELMWSRIEELESQVAIRSHLHSLCRSAHLDRERAQAWTVVRAVDYRLWDLAHGLTINPPRCASRVEALM